MPPTATVTEEPSHTKSPTSYSKNSTNAPSKHKWSYSHSTAVMSVSLSPMPPFFQLPPVLDVCEVRSKAVKSCFPGAHTMDA
mmetsp:Transcript_19419/g.33324  ORF Transcript_19419/g.33324 Transcript_19419/m.33324 type:complete len:82 (+) Transcript_19419:1414-1659(+)